MSIQVRIARQGADEGITLRENSLVGMPIPVRVRHPGCTLEVKKGDRTIRVIHILSPGEISEDLKKQRDQIEADVDASIDRFLLITNRNFAKRIWQMIRYFRQPEEGFRVLQEYMHNPDDARLRDEIRSHPSLFSRYCAFMNQAAAEEQQLQGKNPDNPLRAFMRASRIVLATAALELFARKFHGNLNLRQEIFYETYRGFADFHDGNESNPLHRALLPHMERAIGELTSSYETLRQHVRDKTPLLSEECVRSFRDEIARETMKDFDRLVEQSFNDERPNDRKTQGLNTEIIPEGIRFGAEFEGFIPSRSKFFEMNLSLYYLLMGVELPVSLSLIPKVSQSYSGWSVTCDSSVRNPLEFAGKQTARAKFDSLGLEIISPVLEGSEGQRQLLEILKALRIVNMRTNESTGLHVHVDLSNAALSQLKNLGTALIRNEEKLDALVDPDRRGSGNHFCRPIPEGSLSSVQEATTVEEFVEAMNPGHDRDRKYDFTGLVIPDSPTTIQYRGEGGANYLMTAGGYIALLVRFTKEALDNPDIDLDALIE